MNRFFVLVCCAALLAACGIKRPLMAPKDIPEYEEGLRSKREGLVKQQETIDRATAEHEAQKIRDDAAKSVITPTTPGIN